MKIGVIADTHDNVPAVERAIELFQSVGVECILHCGDVVAPPVIPYFEGHEFHLVFGNNDGDRTMLRQGVAALGNESTCHGRFARLTIDGVHIALVHGEDLDEVEAYARTGAFDFVLHGHHHETRAEQVGDTIILNPGGHFPTIPVEHQCVVTIETSTNEHEFHTIGLA